MVENKKVMARNILRYLNEQGLTAADLCKDLGIKSNTFSDWVNAKSYPRIDKIEMMANYFGVSKAALVEDSPVLPFGNLSKHEELVIAFYRNSDDSIKKIIDKILDLDQFENARVRRLSAYFNKFLENLSDESIKRLSERAQELQEIDRLKQDLENKTKK